MIFEAMEKLLWELWDQGWLVDQYESDKHGGAFCVWLRASQYAAGLPGYMPHLSCMSVSMQHFTLAQHSANRCPLCGCPAGIHIVHQLLNTALLNRLPTMHVQMHATRHMMAQSLTCLPLSNICAVPHGCPVPLCMLISSTNLCPISTLTTAQHDCTHYTPSKSTKSPWLCLMFLDATGSRRQ